MPLTSARTVPRHLRKLAGACLLAPALWCGTAHAQSALDTEIAEIRETVRFKPDQALAQLQQMENEARLAPPQTKGEFLSQLALTWRYLGRQKTAMSLAEELEAFAKSQNDTVLQAKAMLTKTYVLSAMGEQQSSQALAFEAVKVADRTGDLPLRVQATITSGQSHAEQGNYPVALQELQHAVDLAHQVQDDLVPLASALNALTALYTQMKEYDKGWEVLAETIAVSERMQSPGRLVMAKTTEYGLSIDSNQPKRARAALLTGLDLARKLGAKRQIATNLVNLSDISLKEHDFTSALRYGSEAIAAGREINALDIEAIAYVNMGQAHMGMGRLAEGRKNFELGLAYYEKAGDKPQLQSLLSEFGQSLERSGDYAGAIAAYHRERKLSTEIFEAQRNKAMWELQERYDTEKKKRQIELLSHENKVKGAELENRRLQQRVWWLLALVFALASAVVGLLYRKVRHANAQLKVKNLELKQQSALDPLTALYNRRHFQEYMRSHNHAERRNTGSDDIVGALFLLDVDHFKHVNDTYGHAAGDAVLKMIADTLRVALRETDMIVRWGGEEFLAFLPAIPRAGVDEVARRILSSIASQRIEYQGSVIQVNVSVGFAPFPLIPADAPLPWERAVNLVDMALYLAKSHGRNRAYGVRGFHNVSQTTMENIEQDLERAWRSGFVDLSVVHAAEPDGAPPANVVSLKTKSS